MARKPELELDLHEKIFDAESERNALHKQMAQLSPRRAVEDGSFATMTLPFYEDISPSAAVEKLFHLFHTRQSNEVEDETTEVKQEGQEEGDQTTRTTDSNDPQVASISREEFNRLRRCVGKPSITPREWDRALEELGMPKGHQNVLKKDFKALFGPSPFFGSETVQGIIKYVMSIEEHMHFTRILLDRFGAIVAGPSNKPERMIGFSELRNIQIASCVEVVYGDADWMELLKKLTLPSTHVYLDYMQFAEVFTVTIKNKKVFGTLNDPASVVYAVLANDNVLATVKDSKDSIVSRKAFTNLLRLKKEKVNDEKWMQLLETMQTSYQLRKGTKQRSRKDSMVDEEEDATGGHGHDHPLVVVRNTRNQVLSYTITFDEHGEVGLTLQSDFYGHCLTVASIKGQAAKHSIIQKDDIVASIGDGTVEGEVSLSFDTMAPNKQVEQERVAMGLQLLNDGDRVRKITFYRQESYFQYEPNQTPVLHLFIKTLDEVLPNGKIIIQMPEGSDWGPIDYRPGSDNPDAEAVCLQLSFVQPNDPLMAFATVVWNPITKAVEITMPIQIAIGDKPFVAVNVIGLACGRERLVGPCELSLDTFEDGEEMAHYVTMRTDWKHREATMQRNPVRERFHRPGNEYVDPALTPLRVHFSPGESGINLVSDFFGQCATIDSVKLHSQADTLKLQPHDILTSIAMVGENDSLDFLNCIKPFAMTHKHHAKAHLEELKQRLTTCYKTGNKYALQFLRLNAHFYHFKEKSRTLFSMNALTNLREDATLVVKMPSAKWHVNGPLTGAIIDPEVGASIKEVFWDSQHHTLHMILGRCSIAESTPVTIEIYGLASGTTDKQCAGPGEVVNVMSGAKDLDGNDTYTTGNVPEMAFELHEHWHSFVVGHQGLEASKVIQMLKDFDTNPSKLWDVLEYTSLLFNMYKAKDTEYLGLTQLNRLIRIVCGDTKQMKTVDWNTLCRNMGAKAIIGLSRRQFACCWYDVVGLSGHSAKDIYVRLHTAERLFMEFTRIYQDKEEQEELSEETIERVVKFASIPSKMRQKAFKELKEKGLNGWDLDMFSQIVCGSHSIVKFEDNAMGLWIKLFYSRKLFEIYSTPKKQMRKNNLSDLLNAAKITKPKLTNELWTEICDSLGLDDTAGLGFPEFLEVYAGDLLGSRHAVADWYRIETFKLLPERRGKEEQTKEAVLSVAPEKVNVKDIAAKVLEETASADELFQDLLDKGLEFSKLDTIQEKETTTLGFEGAFMTKKASRRQGFLHISIRSISELADHILQQDTSFNREQVAEELYVMFEITDAQGLKPRLPTSKRPNPCEVVTRKLFGEMEVDHSYLVKSDEMWDQGETQVLMRALAEAEKQLKGCKPLSPEYQVAYDKLKVLEKQITPPTRDYTKKVRMENEKQKRNSAPLAVFDGRIFSSLIIRDRSPDAIVRFPDDQFRLRVDLPAEQYIQRTDGVGGVEQVPLPQLYVVCKLFKRVGSAVSRLQLQLEMAKDAVVKAEATYSILKDLVEQQQEQLRHTIAEEHSSEQEAMANSTVWTTVSKLKQKRQDLADFEIEYNMCTAEVTRLTTELKDAKDTQLKELELLHNLKPSELTPVDNGAAAITGAVAATDGAVVEPSTPVLTAKESKKKAEKDAKEAKRKEQLLKAMTKQLNAQKVKFIGQAYFDLDGLLDVLYSDKEHTEDLAMLRTETHEDVGVMLLTFEYKCASLQLEAPYVDLPSTKVVTRKVQEETPEGKEVVLTKVEKINETAYQYPSNSRLEIKWQVGQSLMDGDRLVLLRESEQPGKNNMNMPYFLVLWNAVDASGESTKRVELDEEEEGKLTTETHMTLQAGQHMDWWIPPMLKKVYSFPRDLLVETKGDGKSGILHLPSSIDLSLPPGMYRIYILRNEVDKETNTKYRTILGKTSPLTVMPGINSVHTAFGTTPLIDVKPLSASLQVFASLDREYMMAALSDTGAQDEQYKRKIAIEQEYEVTKIDLTESMKRYERVKAKREGKMLLEKIEKLKVAMQELTMEKTRIMEEAAEAAKAIEAQEVKVQVETGMAQELTKEGPPPTKGTNTVLLSNEPIVFSYRFHGGAPSVQDRIVILPAEVVKVSDSLRSSILGRLQSNDPQQVEIMRTTMQRELLEVEAFFGMQSIGKSIKVLYKKFIKPLLKLGKGGNSTQSDAYKIISGTGDGSFVWAECTEAYKNAPKIAKASFSYIIRDLLDEISARKDQLGLTFECVDEHGKVISTDLTGTKPGKKDKLTKRLMRVGLEVPVIDSTTPSSQKKVGEYVSGEVTSKLGSRFRQGGFYIAKYVRRADPTMGANQTAGEICRYGPFYVEPALFSYSPTLVAIWVGKKVYAAATSDQGRLTLSMIGQVVLSAIKYFLAVVSLSFNISVLAGNFNVSITQVEIILDAFKYKLATLLGPIEHILMMIYDFLVHLLHKLWKN